MATDPAGVAPQPPDVSQADRDLVQRAFALGWHVTELYHFDKVVTGSGTHDSAPGGVDQHAPASASAKVDRPDGPPVSLPGIGSLPASKRRSILIGQVRHDLQQPGIWTMTPGGTSNEDLDTMVREAGIENDIVAFKTKIAAVHDIVLSGLTISNFRLGKSYGLGRALAESAIIPCSIDAQTSQEFKKTLGDQFEYGRVFTLQSWLLDLRDWFDQYASDAVATTLGGWALWTIRPTVGQAENVEWEKAETVDKIKLSLRRQADVWRGLLSGEKTPKNIAGADYYFAAMASVVRRIAGLALRFFATGIGLFLLLVVIVAGLALFFQSTSTQTNNTGVLAAVVALLSALGITTGSIGATIQKAWSKAEVPLWDAEVTSAVANAAWHNPAPLGSIEMIQVLLAVGGKADPETETRARHPYLTQLRNLPVGRLGIVLMVASTAVALFAADAGHLERDASFFLPPLCVVGLLVLIDGWDLLIGLAAKQSAPYLALPERIAMPTWLAPVSAWLAPILVVTGILAGHFFWH